MKLIHLGVLSIFNTIFVPGVCQGKYDPGKLLEQKRAGELKKC